MTSSGKKPCNPPHRAGILVSSDTYGGAERYVELLSSALDNDYITAVVIGRLENAAESGIHTHQLAVGPKWSRRTVLRSLRAISKERRMYLNAALAENISIAHLQFKREQI